MPNFNAQSYTTTRCAHCPNLYSSRFAKPLEAATNSQPSSAHLQVRTTSTSSTSKRPFCSKLPGRSVLSPLTSGPSPWESAQARVSGAMSKPPARCALVSHGMSLTIGAQARVWHQCEAQSAQLSSAPKATTRSRRDEGIKTQTRPRSSPSPSQSRSPTRGWLRRRS